MAEQTEEKVEAIKNCAGCKKTISRARRYYRNGSYYCNKNCFQKKMAELAGAASESKGDDAQNADVKQAPEEQAKDQAQKEPKAESKKEPKAEAKKEPKKEEPKAEAKQEPEEEKAEAAEEKKSE